MKKVTMNKVKQIFLFSLSLLLVIQMGIVQNSQTANASGTPSWIKKLDPTDKSSSIRQLGRDIDDNITQPVFEGIKKEVRSCLSGGCDITRPEVQKKAADTYDKLENAAEKARTRLQRVAETYQAIDEYVNNPYYGVLKIYQEIGKIADKYLLNGFVSRNFGHVTNKQGLQAKLREKGILILGYELSHEEYIAALTVAGESVASANPAPLGKYFLELGIKSYKTMGSNILRAVDEAPQTLNLARFRDK